MIRRLIWFGLSLAVSLSAQALSNCVEELALPGYARLLRTPGVIDVDITIGADGKAESARFSTGDAMTQVYLKVYFITESTYNKKCRGQRIHFVVRYIAEGEPTFEPRYETRWRAPNEFIVKYHPLKPIIN